MDTRWLLSGAAVIGTTVIAATWLTATMLNDSTGRYLALLAIIAIVPLIERFSLPGNLASRTETATFALIVTAAAVHSPAGAAAIGLLSLLIGNQIRPHTGQVTIWLRMFLLVGLVTVGSLFLSNPFLAQPTLIVWLGILSVTFFDQTRRGQRTGMVITILAIGWIVMLLTMQDWTTLVPVQMVQDGLISGSPAMRFALGFMTADLMLVSAIALDQSGRNGLRFWRRELLPTFVRYNLLTVVGVVTVAAYEMEQFTGLLAGLALLAVAVLYRYERDQSRRRLIATICALSSALDARDSYTKGHSDRVAAYAVAIAGYLGWSARQRRDLEIAAHLHDVGKIGVPNQVLEKAGKLTPDEFAMMQEHAGISARIARNIPDFQTIAMVIRQHHERLDGSGYPDGIRGDEQIPPARVLAVADVFDALTSERPYREAMSQGQALGVITGERGTQLDPDAVDALVELTKREQIDGALQYAYCLTH